MMLSYIVFLSDPYVWLPLTLDLRLTSTYIYILLSVYQRYSAMDHRKSLLMDLAENEVFCIRI